MDKELITIATNYALGRLGEVTTWTGIIGWALGEMHIQATPDMQGALVHVGLALSAALLIAIKGGWRFFPAPKTGVK